MAPESFRRHTFVRLLDAVAESADDAETLRAWIAASRPLIVRRPCLSADGAEVFLGLALPGRRRIAGRAPRAAVSALEPPPLWTGPFCPGFAPRLFGSHAWQALTGLSYVTKDSDLDLLLAIDSVTAWRNFQAEAGRTPWRERLAGNPAPDQPRIDLEIVLRGDVSFSWREFAGLGTDVLIKTNRQVGLARKADLEGFLP